MQWHVQNLKTSKIYQIEVPLFAKYNFEQRPLNFLLFIHVAGLLGVDGDFFNSEDNLHGDKFLFICDEITGGSYEPPSTANAIEVVRLPADAAYRESDITITIAKKNRDQKAKEFVATKSKYYAAFLEVMQNVAQWNWLSTRVEVLGPVSSCVIRSSKYNFDVLLFGDIHDDLTVKDHFTDAQVRENFEQFFTASSGFYQENKNFKKFKYIVRQMKHHLFSRTKTGQENTRQLFIWEFLVCILHLLSLKKRCVDVIVEDRLQSEYEDPTRIDNYLEAVRYLFSICPMIANPDSPFEAFVPQCKKLFPNMRYHRIDLRYQVQETVKSNFIENNPDGLKRCILYLLENLDDIEKEKKEQNGSMSVFLKSGILALMDYHNIDKKDDIVILTDEFLKMFHQFKNSYLADNAERFLTLFSEASTQFWDFESAKEKEHGKVGWFFLRTMMTDIYGLSRLYRKDKENRNVNRFEFHRFTKICGNSPYEPRHVICYLGDYHAKVWRAVITGMDEENYVITQDQPFHDMNRVMVFPSDVKKPFMQPVWDDPQKLFKYTINRKRDLQDSDSYYKTNFFLMSLSPKIIDEYYVTYIARLLQKENSLTIEDLDEQFPDFKKYHLIAAGLNVKRNEMQDRCQNQTDVFNNKIQKMGFQQLDYLYIPPDEGKKKNNNNVDCYPADFMYETWVQSYKDDQAFRNPVTRRLVSPEERTIILKKMAHARTEPKRNENNINFDLLITDEQEEKDDDYNDVKEEKEEEDTRGWYRVDVKIRSPKKLKGLYFLTLVRILDDKQQGLRRGTVMKEFNKALLDFLKYTEFEFGSDNKIYHKSIHFNNWRTRERWLEEGALLDFKSELAPFVEIW